MKNFYRTSCPMLPGWATRFFVVLLIGMLPVLAQAQTISGFVYTDGNNNGIKDAPEGGFPFVTVKAYGPNNTLVSSATTAASPSATIGRYTLSGLTASVIYRLEFTLPSGYSDGSFGTGNSSVMFATPGATDVNFGLYSANDCVAGSNPALIFGCARVFGNTDPGLASYLYNDKTPVTTPNGAHVPHTDDALVNQVGVAFGLAVQSATKKVFFTSITSTRTDVFPASPDGPGAIYMADYSGTAGARVGNAFVSRKLLMSLADLPAINLTNQFPIANDIPQNGLDNLTLNTAFGLSGLGGLDVTDDGKKLYVINMGNGSLVKVDVSGVVYASLPATKPSSATTITIPNSVAGCTNGRFRPSVVKIFGNTAYVGGVCDASSTTLAVEGPNPNLNVVVLALNLTTETFTKAFEFAPSFKVGHLNPGIITFQTRWRWYENFTSTPFQPVMADIGFDDEGAMIIGMTNRKVYGEISNSDLGYIVRAARTNTGWQLENGGISGVYTTQANTTALSGPGNNYEPEVTGPGNKWFFEQGLNESGADLSGTNSPGAISTHRFLYSGGVYVLPNSGEVVAGFTDPEAVTKFGTRYLNWRTGRTTAYANIGGQKIFAITGTDAVCEANPIEIGNRVWKDSNQNGIQDPDEVPLKGVTITICAKGSTTPLATAVTDVNGNYIFSTASGTATASTIYSVSLGFNTEYDVKVTGLGSDPSVSGLSLAAISPVVGETAATTNSGATLANSDAFVVSGLPTVTIKTGSAGENNHTYDFAFTASACTLVATATPGICNTLTNQYTVSGTISLTGNTAGGTAIITDGTKTTTVPIAATATAVSYTLAGLPSGTGSRTLTVSLTGCGTAISTYSAPPSCLPTNACLSIDKWVAEQALGTTGGPTTGVVTGAGILGGERDMVFSDLVPTTANGISANVVASMGAFPVPVLEIANASSRFSKLTITWDGTDGNATALNPAGLGGINFLALGATGFTANINTDGAPGSGNLPVTLRIYDISGGISEAVTIVPPYNSVFNPLNVSFSSLTIVSGGGADLTKVGAIVMVIDMTTRNGWDVVLDDFKLVCSPVCALAATATPTVCNSVTNQYTVNGVISLTNNTAGGTATITDGARSTTVSVAASATSVAYSLSGLTSGSGSHTVVANLPGCGSATATYSAPATCVDGCPGNAVGNASFENGTFTGTGVTAFAGGSRVNFTTRTPTDWTAATNAAKGANFWLQSTEGHSGSKFVYTNSSGTTAGGDDACNQITVTGLKGNTCYQLCVWAADAKADGQGSGISLEIQQNNGGPFSYSAILVADNPAWSDVNASIIPWKQYCYNVTTSAATTGFTVWVSANAEVGGSTSYLVVDDVCLIECASCKIAATATPTICNSATNQYTVSGSISLTGTSGGIATITDGAKSMTVSVAASATSVAYSLTGLTSNGASHTVTVSLAGCGTASVTYAAPADCAATAGCPVDVLTTSQSVFIANSQPGPAFGAVSGSAILGGERDVQIIKTVGSGTHSVDVANIAFLGGDVLSIANPVLGNSNVIVTYDGPDNNSALNATGLGGLNMSSGDPFSFELNHDSPTGGIKVLHITYKVYSDATNWSTRTIIINEAFGSTEFKKFVITPASFSIGGGTGANFASVGAVQILVEPQNQANDIVFRKLFGPCVPVCAIAATATPTICNSATNQYTVNGVISLTNTVAGMATITDGVQSTTVTVPAAASSVAYSLTGLTSNGTNHTVVVSLAGCGTASVTYAAPASCSAAPPALAVVVGTPVCNTATNNYTTTATVSLSNATAGTLTLTDNGTVVGTVSVTAGQTTASFTLTGVSGSPPQARPVIASLTVATSSSPFTASTIYAAPPSCTVCSLSLTTSMLANGQIGTAYSETLTTSGGSTPVSYTISAGSLPAGLSLNASTGVISGTPTAPAGTASFTVKVTDSKNCTAVAPLTITTAADPVCELMATATPTICNTANNTYTVTGTVSATNAPATQSLTISVSAVNTVVTLTGNEPVSYTLSGLTSDGLTKTVSVVSSASSCGMTSVTYAAPASCTVAPPALAVVVGTPICNTATNKYITTATVSLTNAPAGTLTLTDNGTVVGTVSVTAGQTTASFTLTGVSGSSPAAHSVVATLSNGVTVVSSTTYATPASCTLCSLSLTTSMLTNGQIGTAYSETLSISGGTAPLTYTVSAGSLPAGLALNPATGVISGTPTAPAGTASFTVTVTDAKNCTAAAPLRITTSAEPVCELTATATPTICNSVNNTYTVTGTVSATNAGANSPQSVTISVNGTSTVVSLSGNGPVSYTLSGLTSDGLTKTVTVVSSASACGMASVTYAAPASCSAAPATASLGNFVFEDVNRDGIQDGGDLPISGATVTLLQNGSAVATTTTSVSGLYSFTGLTPGIPYSVSFTTPSGFSATTSANVGDDAFDNDAINGLTGPYTLTAGENNPTVDAGFVRPPAPTPTLDVDKKVSKSVAKLGEIISYTVTLTNTGTVSATAVVVSETYSAGLSVVPGSFSVSSGSFTPGIQGGTWAIASLPAGATVTLTFQASVTAEGVVYNTASIPGDEARVCTSVPIKVCKGTTFEVELDAPTGYSRYQWYYTAPGSTSSTVVSDGTLGSYTATRAGEYRLVVDEGLSGLCPNASCCPVIIEEVEVPLYTAQGKNPTCVGTTPQANGEIKLLNLGVDPTAYFYQISLGSSFSSVGAVPVSPEPVPADGLVATGLAQGTYTVRLWVLIDGELSCPRDVTVMLTANCDCPEEICVPVLIRKTKSLVP